MTGTPTGAMRLVITLAMLGLCVQATWAQNQINIEPPGERAFVMDLAGLLNREQTEQVRALAEELLNETAIPLIVLTLERKSDYGGGGMSIEAFARTIYDQWGVGHLKIGETDYNRGILLVVARSDREARIELGGGYGDRMNDDAQWIMDNRIIPRFRSDDYGGGVTAGAVALADMARGELKTSGLFGQGQGPTPWWVIPLVLVGIGLAAFTAVSLHRQGRHGWAWAFWAAVIIGALWLIRMLARNSNRSGGGSFGGGSFGGGSSGGGGATGRW